MTPQIKQRIEKIKNGQVPEGYKKTDIGIIPVDWNQTKLGLIASHVLEKNIHSDFKTTFTTSATKGVIKQTDFFDKNISNDENISGYYIVQENDYIYNPRISVSAPCGPINQSHFSEKGIVSPLYIVFKMNGDMGKSKYIESFFCSSLWHRYICEIANYGARHDRMNITNKDFFNMPIPLPPSDEQKKIAEILAMQDKIIELKERKIEELKKLKIYYLSKMFPKKGSNYPEVRFPGFTAPWEQRKLGEVLVSLQNNTLSRADLSFEQGIAKNIHYGDILVKFGEVIDVKTESLPMIADEAIVAKYKSSFLHNGDVIVADTAEDETVGKCTEIAGLGDEVVVSGLHTIPYRPLQRFASGYLGYYMNSASFHNQLLPLMQGIKVTSISKTALQNADILYPKSGTEQAAIGTYFRSLDNLITLHQRELEEEKQKKKALAQLLLTGIVRV